MLVLVAAIDPAVTVAVVAAALGPIGAYLVAARRLSGKIANSDAEQLWEESRAIREWSNNRLTIQDQEIKSLRKALSDLNNRFASLEAENKILRARIGEYESEDQSTEEEPND